jgi:CubicO group peptidase (beta-lactamase class C family)
VTSLPPLPAQSARVPWPTVDWPAGAPAPMGDAPRLTALIDSAFGPRGFSTMGTTNAVLAIHGGVLVAEQYAPGIDAATTLPSWSMAKSILHTLVGVLVADGRMAIDEPAAVAQWQTSGDPRAAITLDQLLHMRSGLAWLEDYVDDQRSDVIEMLFGSGRPDVADYAAARPLAHPPGSTYYYSSGTSCIASALTRDLIGGPGAYERFMRETLFDRIGMRSPIPKFDAAGTWIGSSYCFATARDFARFGLLNLRGGTWDGDEIVPPWWVDHGRRPQPDVLDEGWGYGAHWWNLPDRTDGLFFASGHRGQYLWIVPALDLVIVRSGDSESTHSHTIVTFLTQLTACFGP